MHSPKSAESSIVLLFSYLAGIVVPCRPDRGRLPPRGPDPERALDFDGALNRLVLEAVRFVYARKACGSAGGAKQAPGFLATTPRRSPRWRCRMLRLIGATPPWRVLAGHAPDKDPRNGHILPLVKIDAADRALLQTLPQGGSRHENSRDCGAGRAKSSEAVPVLAPCSSRATIWPRHQRWRSARSAARRPPAL